MTKEQQEQLAALAREYADGLKHIFPNMPEHTYRDKMAQGRNVMRIVMRHFCLVKRSKAIELCRLTMEHRDSADYGLIDGLTDIVFDIFPEQYQHVSGELDNPGITK